MPQVNYIKLLVHRDAMTKIPKLVAPWDAPVIVSQFGENNVIEQGTQEVALDAMPDAKEEMGRLEAMYGVDEEAKQTHAVLVYGRGPAGVKALADAIAGAQGGRKAKAKAEKPADLVTPPDDDALARDKAPDDSDPLQK